MCEEMLRVPGPSPHSRPFPAGWTFTEDPAEASESLRDGGVTQQKEPGPQGVCMEQSTPAHLLTSVLGNRAGKLTHIVFSHQDLGAVCYCSWFT